jgi:hypothetical protein
MARMRRWHALIAFRRDPQILHHPMVAVEQDVAVHDEVAGEALVAGSKGNAQVMLDHYRVFPLTLETGVVGIVSRTLGIGHVAAVSILDSDDLEWIDVDMQRMILDQ